MNILPSQVGADPKKLALLGGLVVVVGVVWFMNRTPDAPTSTAVTSVRVKEIPELPGAPGPSVAGRPTPQIPAPGPRVATRTGTRTRSIDDFRPTLKLKLKEGADISKIDPSIRMDLVAKVRTVPLAGGTRSLFEFGQAPPPPPVEPPKVFVKVGPMPPPPEPPKQPPPPPPPPPAIPLKFYGYSGNARSVGPRKAFFLDGEDIVVAGENDVIRNRYKIIRLGVNSVVVEDTSIKNQQTLPLVEELGQ